jgi:predicted transcriptional regulator
MTFISANKRGTVHLMTEPPTNEDVPQDPSLDEYHRALIEEGIRECDAGEVIEHEVLMRKVAGWAQKPRAR